MNQPQNAPLALNPDNPHEREIMVTERQFALTQRQANVFSQSGIVPAQFKGNIANCVIAMEMAQRMGVGALEVMQNLYVVHGNPSFSSKYLIALVNKSGILKGRLKFRFSGDEGTANRTCAAYGICSDTGEELVGATISMEMADAEGWSKKNGSKWKTMPEQMLMYRAASFWSRVYAPDATMGFYTQEEAEEIEEKEINPQAQVSSVAEAFKSKSEAVEDKPTEGTTAEVIEGEAVEASEEEPKQEGPSEDELNDLI